MKKRVLSLAMAVLLWVQLLPLGALAAADPITNLCEHHTGHDDACYTEAVTPGVCGYVCPDCAAASIADGDTTKYSVGIFQTPAGGGGTVTGAGEYAPGDQVTITATPDTATSYCTAGWLSEELGMNISPIKQQTSYIFTMPEKDVNINITFEQHSHISHTNLGNGTHDVHCIFCGDVQTASEPCVDAHGGGADETPNGWCDKCSTAMTYTISFNANGGTGDMADVTYTYSPDGYTLPANGFTAPDGKAFAGWSDAPDGAVITDSVYYIMGDTPFYAIWEDHTHSFASVWLYDADNHWRDCACGGKFETAAHSGPEATATEPQTCTVCGYEIAPATGYTLTLNYNEASTGVSVEPGSKTITGLTPGEVVDLSKHWPANKAVAVGETTYYFAGFEQNRGDAKVESPTVTVNSDLTLNANWTTTQMFTVTFDTNGGTMPYVATRMKMATQVDSVNSVHKPVRSGHDFVGWSLEDDGTADSGDTRITADCTLYAVWQQYRPSYDDDYYDPPPANVPVNVGGGNDALRYTMVIPGWGEGTVTGGVAIVDAERTLAGEVDLTGLDAQAIRIPGSAVEDAAVKGSSLTIQYPGGTAALITGSGLVAAGDALRASESLQISVTQVDAGTLPENLTAPPEDEEPFEDNAGITHYSVFTAEGIFTYDELSEFGVFGGADESISWGDIKLLYQHMTTEDLETLRNRFSGGSEDLKPFVDWLNEMLQRDTFVSPFNRQELLNMADLTPEQVEFLADMELNDPIIGELRQADLTLEQMQLLQSNAEELREGASAKEQAQYDALLSWLEEAIAQKELETSYAQMDEWIAEADATLGDYSISEVQDAIREMTTDELETFLAKVKKANAGASEITNLSHIQVIISNELESRQEQQEEQETDTTYINVGGERAVFVGAVKADVKAVRASGTTRNLEILADRSNAVAWSTNIDPASLEELIAMLGNAATNDVASNIKAYKVLEDGGLEAKAAKVTLNADGTLTASALSNGNSTYIFVLEPNPYTDVDENDWYYDAAMTMDQRLVTLGASSSFGGGEPVSNETVWTALARLDGVITETYAAPEWVVVNGISDGTNATENITREQLALMLWQYAKSIGMDVSVGESTNILSYTDFAEVSEDAIPAMQWAMGALILPDMGEELQPQREATRAETAVALAQLMEVSTQ